jgi:hypothetical protein
MKTILIIIICCTILFFCKLKAEKQEEKQKAIYSATGDSINYNTQIVPILQKKCSPCHFPGGKMYERMPFDKSETIISHEAGVLKRFKDEEQVSLIKEFIAQSKKPAL